MKSDKPQSTNPRGWESTGTFSTVKLQARVEREENGQVTLAIESRLLDNQEAQILENLFPNTGNRISELLTVESLLASIRN